MGENISTRVAYGRALAEFGADENIYVFGRRLKEIAPDTLFFQRKLSGTFFTTSVLLRQTW